MTSNVALNSASAAATPTPSAAAADAASLAQDFDSFLLLLTTQLQNQDPLSPMDSSEFTNQLVQFSQVEQQINQNSKLDDLIALNQSDRVGSALNYIGNDVMVSGNNMYFNGEREINIDYRLNANAESSNIRIEDPQGNLIRTIQADANSGTHRAIWDGKDDAGNFVSVGNYRAFVDALDAEGEGIQNSIAVSATVNGVDSSDGNINLILEGGVQTPVGGVLSVTRPIATTSSTS